MGEDRGNGPFGELQDHGTYDPIDRNGRCEQLYSGLLTEYSDGVRGHRVGRSIEGWVTSRWSAASGR